MTSAERPETPPARKLTEAHRALIRLLAQQAVSEYLRHVKDDLENQAHEKEDIS